MMTSFIVNFQLLSMSINVQVLAETLFDMNLNKNYASGVITKTFGRSIMIH